MRRAKRIFSLVSLLFLLIVMPPGATAHRYHTSVTRLEYNPDEHLVEITVQTFADDLEVALSKRGGSSGEVHLDGNKKTNALALDYLRTVIALKIGDRETELEWVGMELKGYTVWIYLQAKTPQGFSRVSLRNNLLFELFTDQVNIVNILNESKRTSLVFKGGDTAKEIP